MKGRLKVFLAVEAVMLLIFGIVGYTMFHTLCHKYWNGSGRDGRNYSVELSDLDSVNSYCVENGLEPYHEKSPGDMLSNCIERFQNCSTSSGMCEATYIIAKCYNKNKEVVAEAGDIISLTFFTDDGVKKKYAYPDKYFSSDQMQQIYEFQEKYWNLNIPMIEGYYEKEEFVLTALEVASTTEGAENVQIRNKTDRETIVYSDDTSDVQMDGTFLTTQAKERPVSYHHYGIGSVFNYLAEKYEAARAGKIQAYNKAQFEEQVFQDNKEAVSVEWVEGTSGDVYDQEFTYQGETYYLAYSIMKDVNYVALVDSWLPYILAQIFYFLQAAAIVFSILLYKIYQKRKRLDYAKVVLTNGVAHEMKTPLAVIKNYGECIEAQVNPEKNDHYLSSILNEADRMNAMVIQLLNYTRFSSDDYKVKKELFALDELAVEVLKEKEEAIRQKDLKVKFACSGSMEAVCDGPLIKMVMENYLTNAISHTPEHQNIEINIVEDCRGLKRKIACMVYNQGSFISTDEKYYIWDIFYRGDKARNRKENSTGFGLAICKHIIKLHKGMYGCRDQEGGIEFYFTIPTGVKGLPKILARNKKNMLK